MKDWVKVKHPVTPKEYRPISLCNVVFRIITKTIANRVKTILPNIISDSQSAFIPGRSINDNAMTAFEIFHSMKTKKTGKKGHMAMKLDMSKAYDRVEWGFLEAVMRQLGFNNKWIDLVMNCVKTVSYSVLINGCPSPVFTPERGLRQGDPLSPYLFLLCAETFSALLRRAEVENKIHGMQVARNAPIVSHLFFADDTILFCRANMNEARELENIIKQYEEASGQRINLEKTELTVSANIGAGKKKELSEVLGVKSVEQHTKYLGLPTLIGRSKKQVFSSTVERIIKKMKEWKEKSLSQAGKEVLIKSVIQSIPSYTMNCFLFPITLCQEIEQATARFFWGSSIEERKSHWAKWDILTSPKAKGGLGFREIHYFNIAMLAKQLWGLLQNPNSQIQRILKAKYYKRSDLMNAQLGYKPSYLWRSLLASRDIIREGTAWRVGNGESIATLTDKWVGVNQYQIPVVDEREEMEMSRVADLIDHRTGKWKKEIIESLFLPEIANQIIAMPLSVNGGEDRRIWRFTKNGMFTVKSAYHVTVEKYSQATLHHQSPSAIPSNWKRLWRIQTLPRVRNFLWKVCMNAVPTRANLAKRHIMADAICGMCGEEPETVDHALLHCREIAQIWYISPLRIDMRHHSGSSFKELLWETMDKQPAAVSSLMAFTAWEIWQARNKLYFEDKKFEMISVLHRAQNGFMEYTASYEKEEQTSGVQVMKCQWIKPELGKLKCNCDAAVHQDGIIGMGFVVRDHEGNIRLAGKNEMRAEGSTTLLEGLAMRYALQMISQYHISVEYVESDNLSLVESVLGHQKPEVYVDIITQDIRNLATSVDNPKFKYVQRQANKVAHHLARGPKLISINHVPDHVRSFVETDVIAT